MKALSRRFSRKCCQNEGSLSTLVEEIISNTGCDEDVVLVDLEVGERLERRGLDA